MLLDHFANRDITDNMERLPEDVANERLHHDIVRLLRDHHPRCPQMTQAVSRPPPLQQTQQAQVQQQAAGQQQPPQPATHTNTVPQGEGVALQGEGAAPQVTDATRWPRRLQ